MKLKIKCKLFFCEFNYTKKPPVNNRRLKELNFGDDLKN